LLSLDLPILRDFSLFRIDLCRGNPKKTRGKNMPDNSPITNLVKQLRAAQSANEGAELERLVRAFASIHDRAQKDAALLAAELLKQEGPITPAKLMKMRQYRELMDTTEAELEKYKSFMQIELRTQSQDAIRVGEIDARNLTSATLRQMGVTATLNMVNPAVIEQLVGFLDPGGPLYKRLDGLPKYTAEQVSQAIIEGVGLGRNPKTIARDITRTMGMGLTDSMRMMRTAQLYSYREANRASYVANGDIVGGWIWYAELDTVTCASCWAMHGTEHSNDEVLDDHHNGRCAMVPMVKGFPNDIEPGVDQFNNLNEEEQKAILGPAKFEAWKDGKFSLADITGMHADEVYGDMRIERSLKDLLANPPTQVILPPEPPPSPPPPPEPKFFEAKTIKGANEYAMQEIGLPFADYTGTDIKIANEWNKALNDNLQRMPELKTRINATGTTQARYQAEVKYWEKRIKASNPNLSDDFITSYARKHSVRTPPNTYAYSIPHTPVNLDGIFINGKYKSNEITAALERNVASGFHPIGTGTVKAVNDHEIGHQIDYLLEIETNPDFRKYYGSLSRDDIEKNLSGYAVYYKIPTKDRKEFIAESWAEYLNNPNPRPIAKTMGKLIEKIYKEKFPK
jgi:hypothetical protein